MASPSADAVGVPDAALPGVDDVAAGLATRRSSPLASIGGRARPVIGAVGRSAGRLGLTFGLPASLRRQALVGREDLGDFPVRPPDYWTGHEPEEELTEEKQRILASTGDPAWDRVITAVRAKARATRKVDVARAAGQRPRGLPSTVHRKGTSIVGPGTAPGGVARRSAAATIQPAPNPATVPEAPRRTAAPAAPAAPVVRRTGRATVRQPASFPAAAPSSDGAADFDRAKQMLRKLRGEEPPTAAAPPSAAAAAPAPAPAAAPADPAPAAPAPAARAATSTSPRAATSVATVARAAAPAIARTVPAGTPLRSTSNPPVRRLVDDRPDDADTTEPVAPPRWWPTEPAVAATPDPVDAAARRAPLRSPGATFTAGARRLPTAGPSAAIVQAGLVQPGTTTAGELRRTALGVTWAPEGAPATFADADLPVAAPALIHTVEVAADDPAGPQRRPADGAAPAPARPARASAAADGRADRAVARAATPAAPAARAADGPAAGAAPAATTAAARRPAAAAPTAAGATAPASAASASRMATAPAASATSASRGAAATSASPATGTVARTASGSAAAPSPATTAGTPDTSATPGHDAVAPAAGANGVAPTLVSGAIPGRRTSAAWPGRLFADGPTLGPAVTTGHAIVRRLARLVQAGAPAATGVDGLPVAAPSAVLGAPEGQVQRAAVPGTGEAPPVAGRVDPRTTTVHGRPLGTRSVAQQLPGGFVHGTPAGFVGAPPSPPTPGSETVAPTPLPDAAPPAVVVRPAAEDEASPAPTSQQHQPARTAQRGPLRLVHDADRSLAPPPAAHADATADQPTAGTADPVVRRTPAAAPLAGPAVPTTAADPLPAATAAASELVVPEPAIALARLTAAPPAVVARVASQVTPEDAVRAVAGARRVDAPSSAPTGAATAVATGTAAASRHAIRRAVTAPHAAAGSAVAGTPTPMPTALATDGGAAAVTISPAPARPSRLVLRTPDEVRRAAEATLDPGPPPSSAVAATPPPGDTPQAKVERFQQILRAAGPLQVTPLPAPFRPLAEQIVGSADVHVSTGEASRRALASVGTDAATTGNVVHLQRSLDDSPESLSVLAHELTHVAAASPIPRFHGGVASTEESRADRAEHTVRRAVAAVAGGRDRGPSNTGIAGLPVGSPMVVQRREATDDIVQRVTEAMHGDTVQRRTTTWTAPGHEETAHNGQSGQGDATIQRRPGIFGGSKGGGGGGGGAGSFAGQAAAAAIAGAAGAGGVDSSRGADVQISEAMLAKIVRAVEDRLLEEIERRGGLWRGGF